MKHFFFAILSLFILITAFSCKGKEDSDYITERVDSFATHYFNWQYEKCIKFVKPESKVFIQLAATNVTEEDVQMLRSQQEDASIDIKDFIFEDANHANIKIAIHNFISVDTTGRKAKSYDYGEAEIRMVKEGKDWYVEMPGALIRTAFLQQSE